MVLLVTLAVQKNCTGSFNHILVLIATLIVLQIVHVGRALLVLGSKDGSLISVNNVDYCCRWFTSLVNLVLMWDHVPDIIKSVDAFELQSSC